MSGLSTVSLGELMAKKAGSVDPSKFPEETFDLYSIPAFDKGAPEIITGKEIGSAKQRVMPGDVLLSKIVPHIRRSWVVGADRSMRIIASGEWIVFRNKRIFPPYLRHLLVSDYFHPHFMSTVSGVGGSLLRARPAHVAEIKIPLPPLPEQKRIAAILDKADELRAKRRAALAELDTLVQSIFLEMFGDPVANPKGWTRASFGELIVRGPQNGLYKPAGDYGSGTPILRIDGFYDGVVTNLGTLKRIKASAAEQNLYGLDPGDIVVNRVNSREYLGKSALIPNLDEPTVFESNMMRLSVDPNMADPVYVIQFLQTGFIKAEIAKAAKHAVNQSSINQKDVKGFEFSIPPLPLQRTFAARVAAVEKLKAAHRASLAEFDALFASLQHRAFRGEL